VHMPPGKYGEGVGRVEEYCVFDLSRKPEAAEGSVRALGEVGAGDCARAMTRADKQIQQHIENLDSADFDTSCRAEGYLIRYYGSRALVPLIWACGNPNATVRFRAVWALGQTLDPRAYEIILRLIDDPDQRVRYDATIALGILGDLRALEPLRRATLLEDVSRPGYEGLYRLGLAAVPIFEELLQSESPHNRHVAINCLGNLAEDTGDSHCLDLLRKHLDDPDWGTKEDARFWLEGGYAIRSTDKRLSPP
jgi:HEAT repeat protein